MPPCTAGRALHGLAAPAALLALLLAAPAAAAARVGARHDDEPAALLVVFAHERTGSNLFCDVLNRQRAVVMSHEAFNPTTPYIHALIRRQVAPSVLRRRHDNPVAFVNAMRRAGARRRARAVGFKLFPAHLPAHHISSILRLPRTVAVVLYRRDSLAVYRSLMVARATNQWTGVNTNRRRTTVDLTGFINFKADYAAWYTQARQQVRAARVPSITIEHGDFVSERSKQRQVLRAILDALGVPYPARAGGRPARARQTTLPLSRTIVNYAGLARAVRARTNGLSLEDFATVKLEDR